MSGTILALSPHLDDAAFSCGATMARLADAGHRVIVATVFTRSVPDPQGFALACQLDKGLDASVDYMALRRDEDADAMRFLRAKPLWLDLPEAPHRGYGSAPELFGARRSDDTIVPTLAPLLRALIAETEPALVLAPQAVGDHVDHHAVRDALLAESIRLPIAFWTDYPYALKQAVRARPALFDVPATDVTLARKLDASAAYTSQIGFQFGGGAALRSALGAVPTEQFDANAEAAGVLKSLLRETRIHDTDTTRHVAQPC